MQTPKPPTKQQEQRAAYSKKQKPVVHEADALLDNLLSQSTVCPPAVGNKQFYVEDAEQQTFYLVTMDETNQVITVKRESEKVAEIAWSKLLETLRQIDSANENSTATHQYFKPAILKSATIGNPVALKLVLTDYFNDPIRKVGLYSILGIANQPEKLWYV